MLKEKKIRITHEEAIVLCNKVIDLNRKMERVHNLLSSACDNLDYISDQVDKINEQMIRLKVM